MTVPHPWPPLVPGDADEVARRVAAVLEDAWQRLADRQTAVAAAFAQPARTLQVLATTEEFKTAIEVFHRAGDGEARAFVQRQLLNLKG